MRVDEMQIGKPYFVQLNQDQTFCGFFGGQYRNVWGRKKIRLSLTLPMDDFSSDINLSIDRITKVTALKEV